MIGWANASRMFPAFAAVFLFSVFNCFVSISFSSVYQSEIENQYLGRAMAFYKIFTVLSAVVGILLAPILLETVGLGRSFVIVGILVIGMIVGAAWHGRQRRA